MQPNDLPLVPEDEEIPVGVMHKDDIVVCTATGESPLDHVSDEDPDHDPFSDYPAVDTDSSDSNADSGAVDEADTEDAE
jgi:hypothetical protein